MKTFKDLVITPHKHFNGVSAKMFFDNGYGVSAVRFKIGKSEEYSSYTSNENEWEVAVIKGDELDHNVVYDTPITDDVIGHLNEDGVTDIMKRIQELK